MLEKGLLVWSQALNCVLNEVECFLNPQKWSAKGFITLTKWRSSSTFHKCLNQMLSAFMCVSNLNLNMSGNSSLFFFLRTSNMPWRIWSSPTPPNVSAMSPLLCLYFKLKIESSLIQYIPTTLFPASTPPSSPPSLSSKSTVLPFLFGKEQALTTVNGAQQTCRFRTD